MDETGKYCLGCLRTIDEITKWSNFSETTKQKIIGKIKQKIIMKYFIFFIVLIFKSSDTLSKNSWVGKWVAMDKWQSEFFIEVDSNGKASSNYGNGEVGEWKLQDGNLKIFLKSGKIIFLMELWGFKGLEKIKMKVTLRV